MDLFGKEFDNLYPSNDDTASSNLFPGGFDLYPANNVSHFDFHMHTNHSDGVYSPMDVVNRAKDNGMKLMYVDYDFDENIILCSRHINM